uniref:Uncharacterized protein n=1 Tax=Kalanchoe fedtschenkoi TaxID=63787 RepID=A0A7N0ZWD2_KALFE
MRVEAASFRIRTWGLRILAPQPGLLPLSITHFINSVSMLILLSKITPHWLLRPSCNSIYCTV